MNAAGPRADGCVGTDQIDDLAQAILTLTREVGADGVEQVGGELDFSSMHGRPMNLTRSIRGLGAERHL